MPNIAVCSLYCDVDALRRVTEPNRIAYCELHGYAYHAAYEAMDPLRPASWSKVLLILRHLHKHEWVLWMDADAVIVRPERKLEEIADAGTDVIWRVDENGVNAGVMLLRNSEAVHELLWDCYRQAEFKDHRWWEQAAIMCLLKQRPARVRQKAVPHWAINSYPEEDTSKSFIVHAPGRTTEQRIAIFRSVMTAKVLVLIPVKPNLHPALKRTCRKLAEAMPAANAGHRFTLVLDSRGGGDGHVRSLEERVANIGPIRQALVEEHLGEHDYVMWIDADVVDYPPDLPSRLIERDPLGISAPLVLAAGGSGRFYDTAGFIEEGRWANLHLPYFRQPGPVYDLDGVGCVYMVPAAVYRDGARHEPTPGYTEHLSVCRHARSMGRKVRAYADLIAWHGDLARYGEVRRG